MRIISLAPSNTELVFALGAGEQLIGRTRFCDFPAEAQKVPQISGWTDVDIKKMVDLKPDIVLTSTIVQAKIAEELKKQGLNVLHLDPITLDDVYFSIQLLGTKLNREEEANKVVGEMQNSIEKISENVKNENKPRVYVEEWHRPATASGNWVSDLVSLAGGQNMLKSGERSRIITLEELQKFNPDKIVLCWCGFGAKSSPGHLQERRNWMNIPAVKDKKITPVHDSLLNRPSPRLVQGLQELVKVISPNPYL